jgi:hypothetical protein
MTYFLQLIDSLRFDQMGMNGRTLEAMSLTSCFKVWQLAWRKEYILSETWFMGSTKPFGAPEITSERVVSPHICDIASKMATLQQF